MNFSQAWVSISLCWTEHGGQHSSGQGTTTVPKSAHPPLNQDGQRGQGSSQPHIPSITNPYSFKNS